MRITELTFNVYFRYNAVFGKSDCIEEYEIRII